MPGEIYGACRQNLHVCHIMKYKKYKTKSSNITKLLRAQKVWVDLVCSNLNIDLARAVKQHIVNSKSKWEIKQ